MFAGHRRCCRSVLGSMILHRNMPGSMPVGAMLVGGMLVIGMLACSGALPAAAAESLQRFQRSEPHMGTTFGVVFYAAHEATANRASAAVFARVAELNRVCSDYVASSELSRLSARAPTADPVPVSRDLYRVLAASQVLSARSAGAFDVTIGPLSRLWRRARLHKKPPPEEKITEALSAVGYQFLVVREADQAVELKRPGMRLDLGAIAKGYAVDEALRVLKQQGITRALVSAGGNLAVGDPPPGEAVWRIEIASLGRAGETRRAVYLSHAGVATSGDTYQYLETAGVRYSHILDPRTGWGLTRRRSVTVVAPAGMWADGLATAVSVLGPVEGFRLVEETAGAAAYLVEAATEEGGQPVEYRSSRFADWERTPLP